LVYKVFPESTCLREEDFSYIPLNNVEVFKREKSIDELKKLENNFKDIFKTADKEEKIVLSAILNRIRILKSLIKIYTDIFNNKDNNRFDKLAVELNSIKDLINGIKNNIKYSEENIIKYSEYYFCEDICRIGPSISSLKVVNTINFQEAVLKIEKFINDFYKVIEITNLKDYYQISKSTETFSKNNPSVLIKIVLDINLFPKTNSNTNSIFGKIDLVSEINDLLVSQLKINFLQDDNDIIKNITNLKKELLIKNLRNKSRQIRDVQQLFDNLSMVVLEGNQLEKENKKNNKKTSLTNYLLKITLEQMLKLIFIHFELELFSSYELDYVFYCAESICNFLSTNTNIVASKYGEKILKEEDWVKSNSKRKLTINQKMILDEIYIYNGLKSALKGLAILCRYLKVVGLINNPKGEEFRIKNRFIAFKNTKYFIDLSYGNFIKDTLFDVSEVKYI
jgi:hypothetical protein